MQRTLASQKLSPATIDVLPASYQGKEAANPVWISPNVAVLEQDLGASRLTDRPGLRWV